MEALEFEVGYSRGRSEQPEIGLFAAVIMLAVEDATKRKGDLQERAERWLKLSPICRDYCDIVGIEHRVLIGKLENFSQKLPGLKWVPKRQQWRAEYSHSFLGYFDDKAEAVRAIEEAKG